MKYDYAKVHLIKWYGSDYIAWHGESSFALTSLERFSEYPSFNSIKNGRCSVNMCGFDFRVVGRYFPQNGQVWLDDYCVIQKESFMARLRAWRWRFFTKKLIPKVLKIELFFLPKRYKEGFLLPVWSLTLSLSSMISFE